MDPSRSRCPSRPPTGGPARHSSMSTCRASCADRLGRNPKLHGRKSASKTGSSTIFTAACTIRSRTAANRQRPALGRARLGDQHPPRRQRTLPSRPAARRPARRAAGSPRTPRRQPGWSCRCPARRCSRRTATHARHRTSCGRPCPAAHGTAVRDRPWPPGKAHAARHGPDPPGLRPPSGGPSRMLGTHRTPPFSLRIDEAAALPSPQVVLSCGSTGTTTASDAHPARRPLPGSSPVIGRNAPPRAPQPARAGEGLPSSRRHHLNVPRPLRRGVPHGCTSRIFTASMAFTLITRARHSLPAKVSNDAAGFASRYGPLSCSPLKGFRRWAPPRPVSRRDRQPATGLPGNYPDRTSTGRRRRASDQVMTAGRSPPALWAHSLEY